MATIVITKENISEKQRIHFLVKMSFSFNVNCVIIDTNRVKIPRNRNPI